MDHSWVGAATVELSGKQAAHADLRGSIRVPTETRVDVLEVYCGRCRRPYDDVADEPCIVAAGSREHLIGGPIAERQKRTHTHDCSIWGCAGGGIPQSTLTATAAAGQQVPAAAQTASPSPAVPPATVRRRRSQRGPGIGQLALPIAG